MKLHRDREIFNDLIEATALSLDISTIFIEKDYWVTYVLKQLAKSAYSQIAIFKGGTSLSKAYKIIDRFSEDIDLAIVADGIGNSAVKSLIKEIERAILDENFTEIATPQTSKGSKFRKTVHQYPKTIDGDFGHANENLILELNSFAKPHPYTSKTVSCYIFDFLTVQNSEAKKLINSYQLEPFKINVLDYRRTFCEKISAISRASFESDKYHTGLKEKIRHFYDIYFLMQEDEIQIFLNSNEIEKMIADVREDDQKQFIGDWANIKFHSTNIFNNIDILDELDSYYNSSFKTLVYSNSLPRIKDIKIKFIELAKILKEKDL